MMLHRLINLKTPHQEFLNPLCTPSTLDTFLVRRSILEALQRRLSNLNGLVLDIGCGYMPYKPLVLAPPSRATKYLGLDIKGEGYLIKPDLFWDGTRMPLQDNSVDCAIATEVFEHCQTPVILMRESLRVLKPGGLLFFTVPFLWPLHDVPHDHYRYTPFSLERHLLDAGFTKISLEALGGWDKSLAQMIGLWVRRRPISSGKRAILSILALPIVRWLSRNPEPAEAFAESCMITGMAGTAIKP